MNMAQTHRHSLAGWLLVAAGLIGVVTGVVPLAINTLRIAADERLWDLVDFAAHGVEAMGLSIEWGMLSSAMGLCLGIMLIVAGTGWLRGRPWAAPVSWSYCLAGLTVNAADMAIFALRARPGSMRTSMLVMDGIATLLPLLLGVWLMMQRRAHQDAE